MMCAGCSRTLKVGDRYIKDTPSGFLRLDPEPVIDDLVAGIFGGQVVFCEDCTEPGGDYRFETVYGDEAANSHSGPDA